MKFKDVKRGRKYRLTHEATMLHDKKIIKAPVGSTINVVDKYNKAGQYSYDDVDVWEFCVCEYRHDERVVGLAVLGSHMFEEIV